MEAKIERERTVIGHPAATDRPLDKLVYELYGLTEEGISIVEEASQGGDGPVKGIQVS